MSARMQEGAWSAERCARLLQKAQKSPTGWKACCPAHEDKNPSLFLADGADGLALRCYAGCQYRDIAQALEIKGAVLSRSQNRHEIPTEHFQLGPYHSHWDYHDRAGGVVMRVCRWEQPGGRKDIRPLVRTMDGWKWQHHPMPRPLYNLDRLANEPDAPVLIVEGEKTAAAAQKLFPEFIATTWPGGAQSVGQVELSPLENRRVVLIPDCDAPGRKAMEWMALNVREIASSVRTVDPSRIVANLPDGWDLADALSEGRDVSAWLKAEDLAPPAPLFRSLAEIIAHPTRPAWLIRDVLEENVIALLTGPRGTFKSFVGLHWALTIAAEGRTVAAVSAEGAGLDRRIRAWLSMYAPERDLASMPFYALQQRVNFSDIETVTRIVGELEKLPQLPVVLLIDTVSKNSGGLDEDSNSEVKVFIGLLDTAIRQRFGCTILLVHHTGHAEQKRARGASAWEADTDATYICSRTVGTQFVQVSRERFKDSPELPALTYEAKCQELGEHDEDGRPVTSLVIVASNPDAVASEAKPREPRGGQQKQLLRILKRLQEEKGEGELIWTLEEMRKLGRDAGMDRATARDAAATLCQHYLRTTVGGYRLLKRGES